VCAAAVSDGAVPTPAAHKLNNNGGAPKLELTANPDILAALSAPGNARPRLVVGFAAETEKVIDHAKAKLARKGCDWIVANDVSTPAGGTGVMGGDRNTVSIITREGVETWPTLDKTAVAERLAQRIAEQLKDRRWV
jgi:phosphopantothenoylcysteine decarboxylase/phosphopantothenate--cysteine ligase